MTHLDPLSTLNPAQHQAVTAPACNQLIIAGAGSGKTRVLIERMAWIANHLGVNPHHIMAVTFTNKAAQTLKSRAQTLCQHGLDGAWIGTFHSICHKLLRLYAFDFGIESHFQIIDQDDQLKLIKHIAQDLGICEKQFPSKKIQYQIGQLKEAGIRSWHMTSDDHPWEETVQEVYARYEHTTEKEMLLDFNELLLKVVETLKTKPDFAAQLQARFRFILVDEFQDSNTLQYQLIKLLYGQHSYISIVGDDDQSIYSWRGARVDHMLQFPKEFPDVMTVRLERNYRSTETILEAANQLIRHNQNRLGKELYTEEGAGEKIKLFSAYNEYEEARYIAQCIAKAQHIGLRLSEQAVLYRSNAQSRLIEEQLTRNQIPYRVYGGLRFFDRSEIKDMLAYLRMVVNPQDSSAFLRVINTPTRGIGQATLEKIQQHTENGTLSLWQAAKALIAQQMLPQRALTNLKQFIHLIEHLQALCTQNSFSNVLEQAIGQVGYVDYLQKTSPESAKSKIENLEELINACQQFEQEQLEGSTLIHCALFLSNITLDNTSKEQDHPKDCVQLMTLHSAKGLEFDHVYLAGMEEGLCPHKMALQDGRELEEERRLCYVGITRAKQILHITHAEHRKLYQQDNYQMRSRFLSEIPQHLFEAQMAGDSSAMRTSHTQHNKATIDYAQHFWEPSQSRWKLGQQVQHKKFGTGVVLSTEGQGEDERIQIRFHTHGVKWLLAAYANLEPQPSHLF